MCVYDEKEKTHLNEELRNSCRKGNGYCPWSGNNPCEICSGLKELLAHKCYECGQHDIY